ncbi:MAG: hypothetical protein NXI31_22900 [bacterium]|nr:hypothetical protein [bacterium]
MHLESQLVDDSALRRLLQVTPARRALYALAIAALGTGAWLWFEDQRMIRATVITFALTVLALLFVLTGLIDFVPHPKRRAEMHRAIRDWPKLVHELDAAEARDDILARVLEDRGYHSSPVRRAILRLWREDRERRQREAR